MYRANRDEDNWTHSPCEAGGLWGKLRIIVVGGNNLHTYFLIFEK